MSKPTDEITPKCRRCGLEDTLPGSQQARRVHTYSLIMKQLEGRFETLCMGTHVTLCMADCNALCRELTVVSSKTGTDEITLTVTEDELRILIEALGCLDTEWSVGDGQDDSPYFQSVKAKVLTARYEE